MAKCVHLIRPGGCANLNLAILCPSPSFWRNCDIHQANQWKRQKSLFELKFKFHPFLQPVIHLVFYPLPHVLLGQLSASLFAPQQYIRVVQQQYFYLPAVTVEIAQLFRFFSALASQFGQFLEIFMHEGFAVCQNGVEFRLGGVEWVVVWTNLRQRQRLGQGIAEVGLFGYGIHAWKLFLALKCVLELDFPQFLVKPPVFPLDIGVFFLGQPVLAAAVLVRIVVSLFFIERSVMFFMGVELSVFRHEGVGLLEERSEGVSNSMVSTYPGHHNNIISNVLNITILEDNSKWKIFSNKIKLNQPCYNLLALEASNLDWWILDIYLTNYLRRAIFFISSYPNCFLCY